MIWGLEHKTYKEKLRAGSVEHGEGKAQGEFDSSLHLSNWDSIKKGARFFSEVLCERRSSSKHNL